MDRQGQSGCIEFSSTIAKRHLNCFFSCGYTACQLLRLGRHLPYVSARVRRFWVSLFRHELNREDISLHWMDAPVQLPCVALHFGEDILTAAWWWLCPWKSHLKKFYS